MHHRPLERLGWFLAACLLWMVEGRGSGVVISEVFYQPSTTNVLEEFIELWNRDVTLVDLTRWKVSKGIRFEFPAGTQIAPGGYLVVAAHEATFRGLHPGVTNLVAGWVGKLSDDGDRLVLEDAGGQVVNELSYAPGGDWAVRRLAAADRFKKVGWEWYATHAGLGASLELINLNLPNEHPHNWASSHVLGGTPGRPNSVETNDIAPLFHSVGHFPQIPKSTESVIVQARVVDEKRSGVTVTLYHRTDGEQTFHPVSMLDDGLHRDGIAGDGLYAAILPVQTKGTIVEYYLMGRDEVGHERTYPAVLPNSEGRTANLLYQVDEENYVGPQPLYRLVMTRSEYDYLRGIWSGAPESDAAVNGTFVGLDGVVEGGTTVQVRQGCDFRNRGHGTRFISPHNIRVNFPQDKPWQGRVGINLNTQFTLSQSLGSTLMRRVGLMMPESRPVRVRVNGENLAGNGSPQFGFYVANELVDGRFVERQMPQDAGGNLYRGVRDAFPGNPKADLAWHGDTSSSYTNAYFKQNHKDWNDWSDLIRMIDVLNNSTEAEYVAAVRSVADVEGWMRYFAINTLLDNQETALSQGYGDDYVMYRGELDPRFRLLPYDMDSLMGMGTRTTTFADGLFRMLGSGNRVIPALDRFMKHPEFAPIYYGELVRMMDEGFEPARMDLILEELHLSFGHSAAIDAAIANMKAFNASHSAYVKSKIPRGLTVTNALVIQNGYARTTESKVALGGVSDAVRTRSVRVNGVPAAWSGWQASWTRTDVELHPGINRVAVSAFDASGHELEHLDVDIWYEDGSVQSVSGNLGVNTTWTPASGPYVLTGTVTVPAGSTLTVEPGTTVYLAPGVDLVVANGGKLLAEGRRDAPIRFTRQPGTSGSWGGLVLRGAVGSPETRLSHVHLEYNGTTAIEVAGATVSLDHLTFGTTDHPYLALDGASFVISQCVFPSSSAAFELVHGTQGIKPGGHGIFRHNYFGTTTGYNDIIDFTGGNRATQPILQFLGNVFMGATDDILDLDNTDAWIEGNIFLHVHKNGSPDSASAVSGGNDTGQPSEITIVGNLFFDCDQAATAKEQNFYVLMNNTIVRQTKIGGLDTEAAVVNMADEGKKEAAGMYLEGNIVVDAEQLVRFLTNARVTFTNNILPLPWAGLGGGNRVMNPMLRHVPSVGETQFKTWEEAQVMWEWLALMPGSPAIGMGFDGRELGASGRFGAAVWGEPFPVTASHRASLHVGFNRTGDGITPDGWPGGAGYTQYRWRLDGGDWSGERGIQDPISLESLTPGPHYIEVVGRRDSGMYQDDLLWGTGAVISRSRTWVVDPNFVPMDTVPLRINEILARNVATFTSGETTPDLVELHNEGDRALDVSRFGITDDPTRPYRFQIPLNTVIPPGGYLILIGDSETNAPGLHLGFGLNADGDRLHLFQSAVGGGALLDSVEFGVQIPDYSIGRTREGGWVLGVPTLGAPNEAAALGSVAEVRINEWLANGRFTFAEDFVELYNAGALPVALGGLYLSDAPGYPDRHTIPPLSFLASKSCQVFIADGDDRGRALHLNFKLASESGTLRLADAGLRLIDIVSYGPQQTDSSMGRSPSGGSEMMAFRVPTPGGLNPGYVTGNTTIRYVERRIFDFGTPWKYNADGLDLGSGWSASGFEDGSWKSGGAPLGLETSSPFPYPMAIQTPLTINTASGTRIKTYYFRKHFNLGDNVTGFTLYATNLLDDGAVFYVNGVRAGALRVAANPALYTSDAVLQSDEGRLEVIQLSSEGLVPGDNVLGVEVHQSGNSSTDVYFAMALGAVQAVTNSVEQGRSAVVLNEVLVRNLGYTNAAGQVGAWVELFNTATTPVHLDDVSLTDDPAVPRKWVCPTGVTLLPMGRHVVSLDPLRSGSATNAAFGLAQNGGGLYLFDSLANGGGSLDALVYGLPVVDYSFGRVPDGTGDWILTLPTEGQVNTPAGLGSPEALRLNEWMADPVSGSDWIELYNSDAAPVSLSGLYLTDDLSNRTKSPIHPLSYIGFGKNGYVQLHADKIPGANHVDFKLSKAGSELGLFAPSGLELDGLVFGMQSAGISEGRLPDGASAIQKFPGNPTPAATNAKIPLVLDSDGDGMSDAWELAHGLNPASPDGGADPDGDGLSNLEEFHAGTNPRDPASGLELKMVLEGEDGIRLSYEGVVGRSYLVEMTTGLGLEDTWQPVVAIPVRPSSGTVTSLVNRLGADVRFFRVRVTGSLH